jgi:hypothetical protein
MARSTGQFFYGSLPTAVSGQSAAIFNTLTSEFTAFLSGGVAAWTQNNVTSTDRVFISKGDRTLVSGAGDAHLVVQMTLSTNTLAFRTYQDWSTLSSTGTRVSVNSSTISTTLSDTDAVSWWGVRNEYEITFVLLQGGPHRCFSFGSPMRSHIPAAASGIALTTASASTGSSITLSLDRDLTGSIQVGQTIWVYDVTPVATALRTDVTEVCTVTSVGPSTVTVQTLANNHQTGAIVGLDPSPMYLGQCSSTSGFQTVYTTNRLNGAYGSATTNTAGLHPVLNATPIVEGDNDPAPTNYYVGGYSALYDTVVSVGGYRGRPEHISWWPVGTQQNGDRMIPNFNSAAAIKIFPTALAQSSFGLGIGPGAV